MTKHQLQNYVECGWRFLWKENNLLSNRKDRIDLRRYIIRCSTHCFIILFTCQLNSLRQTEIRDFLEETSFEEYSRLEKKTNHSQLRMFPLKVNSKV